MHSITKIKIKNYKSIKDAEFHLAPYTALVGYNNAGKTNLLSALQWLIKKSSLGTNNFFDAKVRVEVEATVSGINESVLKGLNDTHRNKIQDFVSEERMRFRRVQASPDAAANAIKLEFWKDVDEEWVTNPAGIDNAISALFPEPIFVGAMSNAGEDISKSVAGTTVGKLLREISHSISDKYADVVTSSLADIERRLTAGSPEKDEDLRKLDEKIQIELSKLFGGISAETHFPTPTIMDFFKGGTLRIKDTSMPDGHEGTVDSFGHGSQRAIQLALVKCLADWKRDELAGPEARTTLLLIDEPELYLHPQAVETVRAALSALAGEGYQIIITTHSPMMVTKVDVANALVIRRDANGTRALPSIKSQVIKAVDNAEHQAELLFEFGNAAEILFAETVLIVEGKTERAVLPSLYEKMAGCSLAEDRIGLVSLGGVGNLTKAMEILSAIGVPNKAIVDLDYAFKGGVSAGLLDNSNPAITACKGILSNLEAKGQVSLENGLPQRHDGQPAIKGYELLAEEDDAKHHIYTLASELAHSEIWLWKKGAIEKHLGLASKSSSEHAQFLESMKNDGFLENLSDFSNLGALINWLKPSDTF